MNHLFDHVPKDVFHLPDSFVCFASLSHTRNSGCGIEVTSMLSRARPRLRPPPPLPLSLPRLWECFELQRIIERTNAVRDSWLVWRCEGHYHASGLFHIVTFSYFRADGNVRSLPTAFFFVADSAILALSSKRALVVRGLHRRGS